MRVAIVTNWDERCGNAEYAANLVKHLDSSVEVKIVARPLTFEHIYAETRDVALIHFNCVTPEFRSITTELWPWPRFKEGHKLMTMMLQDSSQAKIAKTATMVHKDSGRWSRVFDCVATHERFDGSEPNVCTIPHGILLQDVSQVKVEPKIGSAGFPMPWKGFVYAARAARNLGLGYLAIIPESHHIDVQQTKNEILHLCPKAEVITDWLTHEQIIKRLAECFVTAFPYDVDNLHQPYFGISGGVRFGLAAKRPIVISRCSLFKDLFSYEDEVYFLDKYIEDTISQVVADWNSGKRKVPKRILEDMNWHMCATMYQEMWSHAKTHWVEMP